jgi:hypothetical protein
LDFRLIVAYYSRETIAHKSIQGELFVNKTYPKLSLFICLAAILLVAAACNQTDSTPANTEVNAAPPASNTAAAPVSINKDISGAYTVTGTNEGGGGEYGGSLNITKRDDVYQFSWASGAKTYDGVGVRTDNAVAVSFTEGSDGKGCGVILYKIGSDGSLDGKAGYWGVNTSETEKAKRTSGTDLEGSYDITGSNPDGKEYKGKLAVKKAGVGYSFAWDAGSSFTGFGVRSGDKVAVGLGGTQCGFVSYDIKPDGTLEGKWGGQGSTSVGTEVAKKK